MPYQVPVCSRAFVMPGALLPIRLVTSVKAKRPCSPARATSRALTVGAIIAGTILTLPMARASGTSTNTRRQTAVSTGTRVSASSTSKVAAQARPQQRRQRLQRQHQQRQQQRPDLLQDRKSVV